MPDSGNNARTRNRYPGYDVLAKRPGQSWNEQTRRVIARRLAIGGEPRFFTAEEFQTLAAIASRIVPQSAARPPIPVASLVDEKLARGASDGYRLAGTPPAGDAWRLGLKALDVGAETAYGGRFHSLAEGLQDALLERMPRDIVLSYYSHPAAWSEIGWGGPASPRGYVRMDFDQRDPWEAVRPMCFGPAGGFRCGPMATTTKSTSPLSA